MRGDAPAQPPAVAALWRLRPYLRPYRLQLASMLACALGAEGAAIVIPLLAKSVVDGAIAHHDKSQLLPLGLAAIGLGVAEAALSLIRRWVQGSAVAGMEKSLRDDLYAHLQRLEPEFHDGWQSGQLLSRATSDLSSVRRFAGFGLVFLITTIATFLAVVVLLIQLNWWMGLATGAMITPVLIYCTRFERRYKVLARRVQDQEGDLATLIEEAAAGVRVLKALGRAPEAAARHTAQARAMYRTKVTMAELLGAFWSVLDLIPNAAIALILVLGAVAVTGHALTLGGLVAFITLALQLVWPIEALGYILASGEEAASAAQRVLEIMDTRPSITGPPAPAAGAASPAQLAPGGPGRGRARDDYVIFDQVSFAYPGHPAAAGAAGREGGGEPVLRGVSVAVARGETLVVTGATGSGKTTLLQLVPRLADVTGGRVLVDGRDVRDYPLAELRTVVGFGFEEATLFSASVRENVTFGAPGASEEEVEAALSAAQARFAYDLPWGLDTRIGEQGMALSGGQRQRVALARAILARPAVLVLDDPLSALDVHTEERVTQALKSVLAGTTALVVAHRPSTVALADRVALLDGGVIAAVGSHRELLASQPRYASLMTMEEVAAR
ncbi:MAG TPA: ABC transporter ATP-binding protein [Trebonia sp.]|jgi:ATP-binding cassette subfamily B protein|nr:ABC transporter ATP-binding protein [Trebonia sp.]